MQQSEPGESPDTELRPAEHETAGTAAAAGLSSAATAGTVSPQHGAGSCRACGGGSDGTVTASYVYAIGKVEPRFPTPSVEKEFAQATGRDKTAGLTDRQTLHAVLSKPENRYLVRQLCWVMTIGGLETYILHPHDPIDFSLLVEAVRPEPSPMDLDVVVGALGPIAPPEMCNGLMVRVVIFDQLYSFDRDSLIKAIPRPEKTTAKEFAAASAELFDRVMQIADNAGATDEHRALNYLAVRYPAIYANVAEAFGRNSALSAVDVRSSPLGGARTGAASAPHHSPPAP